MSNEQIILEAKHLTKRYFGLVAVNDLNFQVKKGRIHALIGPNGAGKTTTVNMITGDDPQTEGEVLFCGQPISKLPIYSRAQLGIGRTFQNIKLFSTMTVMENLMMGAQSKTNQNILTWMINIKKANAEEKMLKKKAEEILNFIGMYKYKDEIVSNLAYGRQKVCELGRALMTTPQLILLDEPAAGLNPSERREFVDILRKVYDSGIDLFLIEHNMDVVMNLSHRITVLNFGCKIAEGTPEEIQHDPQVVKAYLGDRFRTEE